MTERMIVHVVKGYPPSISGYVYFLCFLGWFAVIGTGAELTGILIFTASIILSIINRNTPIFSKFKKHVKAIGIIGIILGIIITFVNVMEVF